MGSEVNPRYSSELAQVCKSAFVIQLWFSKSFPEVIILIYPGFRSENVCYICDFKSIDAVFIKGHSYPTFVTLELQQPLLIDGLEE